MCKFEQAEKVECISTCRFIDKVFNLWALVSYSNNISGTKTDFLESEKKVSSSPSAGKSIKLKKKPKKSFRKKSRGFCESL
jgi:hypothetical protein